MAAGTMTTTTGAIFIPELWALELFAAMQKKLVMAGLVWTPRDSEASKITRMGDTIRLQQISHIAARDKSANTDVTYDNVTETDLTITINKHKYVAFNIEDILAAQAQPDLRAEYVKEAAYGLALAVDSDLMALYSGLSQSVGVGGSDISEQTILDGKLLLDNADVPREGRSFVIAPAQENVLLKIPRFTEVQMIGGGGEAIRNGMIGRIHGFDVYVSTNVAASGGTTYNLMFHREAFGLAMQSAPKMKVLDDPDSIGFKTVVHEIYGVAEIRDSHGIVVLS